MTIKREDKINRSVALRCHFPQSINYPSCFVCAYIISAECSLLIELIFMNLWSNWMMIIQTKIDFVHNNLFGAILLLLKTRWCGRPQCTWILRTFVVSAGCSKHCLLFSGFIISNDEILFPFHRFRDHKEKKMFLDDRRRLHTIITHQINTILY